MVCQPAVSSMIRRAEQAGWAGADPYDGLNSLVGYFAIPFGWPARLLVQQAALRIQWVRPLLGTRPSINPKGLGLFLGAVVRGREGLGEARARTVATALVRALREYSTDEGEGIGWGYPFPWQSRYLWAPAGTPNAVVTSTVGWHLLAAAEAFGDEEAQRLANAAARFLVSGLNWVRTGDAAAAVSYTPRDNTQIVNVAGLVARLLARTGHRGHAIDLAAYILSAQETDGCWHYAPGRRGRWKDSFHTGFVLESLLHLRRDGVEIPGDSLRRGFESYRQFFDADGAARLYAAPGGIYDAHSAAQGMVTYAAAADEPDGAALVGEAPARFANQIKDWAIRTLWVQDRGYFAYRLRDGTRDERDFARWVQAWMALGIASAEDVEVRGATSSAQQVNTVVTA